MQHVPTSTYPPPQSLATRNVNIASFNLGRHVAGGEAVGVVTTDSPVNADALAEIRGGSGLLSWS